MSYQWILDGLSGSAVNADGWPILILWGVLERHQVLLAETDEFHADRSIGVSLVAMCSNSIVGFIID